MNYDVVTRFNSDFETRYFEDNGNIWFVAKDVAEALEYSEATITNMDKTIAHVPEIWKGRYPIPTPGGEQEMLCLTEQGVYFFLGRSDKKKALPYQMWIAGEVVPSIRQFGMYATPSKVKDILNNPDAFIELLQAFKSEHAKRQALEAKISEDKPKIIFADAVDSSKESILIGNLAKILRQNGVKIGQNRLFEWLRDNGYLIKCKGERWNMPTQESLEHGLFEIKTRVINDSDGSTKIVRTTKVTGKGQIFFINKFMHNEYPLALDAPNYKAADANA